MAGFYGQNTDVDAAAEALGATQIVTSGIVIKAMAANTDKVYVGNDSSVTAATGFQLAAGEQQSFDAAWFTGQPPGQQGVADIANIYVIGGAANQAVCYWGV